MPPERLAAPRTLSAEDHALRLSMRRTSDRRDRQRAYRTRQLALFCCCFVLLIAAAGWRSASPSVAGSGAPEAYLPLLDHGSGDGTSETLTAVAGTATPTTTATPTVTATATNEPAAPVDIVGGVFVRPQSSRQVPTAYVIVLDTSGSMNLNFVGEAKDGATTLQCGPSDDPARQVKYQQDYTRCQQTGGLWLPNTERRIAIVKAALLNFIDQLAPNQTMQIIASSSSQVGAVTAGWELGTPAGRLKLKNAVLEAGKTSSDPYQASGGTTSATALNQARQILISLPAQSSTGEQYQPAVIFLTDGVANHFLKQTGNPAGFGWYNDGRDNPACANRWDIADAPECQIGLTNTNPQIERPITAMISEANALKQTSVIYVIALAGVNSIGLIQVPSVVSFPYYSEARQPATVGETLDQIQSGTIETECVPSGGTSWINTIDTTHTLTDTTRRGDFGLPADTSTYGYAYLSDANGQMLQSAPIRHDPTNQLSFSFPGIAPGTYHLAAYLVYQGDDRPTQIARLYDWILFPSLSHETSRTFTVSNPLLGSVVPLDPVYLDLQGFVCPAV